MLLHAIGRKTGGIDNLAKKLFHTQHGSVIVCALFGVALAFMFQRVCKGNDCVVIEAPPPREVSGSVYQLEDTCYVYTAKPVSCKYNPKK